MAKYKGFRELYGIRQCIRCFKDISNNNHHYYCNQCWKKNQLDIIGKNCDIAFKRYKEQNEDKLYIPKNTLME